MISEKQLKEFKEIYKKEFGIDLSNQEATEKAIRLLNLMRAIYKPILKDGYEKLQKHKEKPKE